MKCSNCGKEFKQKDGVIYCSRECRIIALHQKLRRELLNG